MYNVRLRIGDVAAFENRQPVTAAKLINKSSLFIQLLGFIRRLELKPISVVCSSFYFLIVECKKFIFHLPSIFLNVALSIQFKLILVVSFNIKSPWSE